MKKEDASLVISFLSLIVAASTALFAWQANEVNRRANNPDVRVSSAHSSQMVHLQSCTEVASEAYYFILRTEIAPIFTNNGGASVSIEDVEFGGWNESYWAVETYEAGALKGLPIDVPAHSSRRWVFAAYDYADSRDINTPQDEMFRLRDELGDMSTDMIWTFHLGNDQNINIKLPGWSTYPPTSYGFEDVFSKDCDTSLDSAREYWARWSSN